MLIKSRVPGIDVAFHPCHPAPISHQIFHIKYARASSMRFWAHCTCYRFTSWHRAKDRASWLPIFSMKGWRSWQRLAADIIYNLFGGVMHSKCILQREMTSLWRMLNTQSFIHFPCKNMKIPYNVLLFQTKKPVALCSREYRQLS